MREIALDGDGFASHERYYEHRYEPNEASLQVFVRGGLDSSHAVTDKGYHNVVRERRFGHKTVNQLDRGHSEGQVSYGIHGGVRGKSTFGLMRLQQQQLRMPAEEVPIEGHDERRVECVHRRNLEKKDGIIDKL